MELNIHKDIKKKLDYFIHTRKIPHIIFHGETGTGKRTILQEFIRNIYDNDKELINLYVIYIDYHVHMMTVLGTRAYIEI